MSQENVELAHEAMRAVEQLNLSRLIELTDPEVEWHSFFAGLREGGVYRGHDGIRQYLSDLGEAWGDLHSEVDDVLAVGEVVLMVGRTRYRGKSSGVEDEMPAGYVVKFRKGRIVFMRSFGEPDRAVQAVGLRE